jgi:hypothetical protein
MIERLHVIMRVMTYDEVQKMTMDSELKDILMTAMDQSEEMGRPLPPKKRTRCDWPAEEVTNFSSCQTVWFCTIVVKTNFQLKIISKLIAFVSEKRWMVVDGSISCGPNSSKGSVDGLKEIPQCTKIKSKKGRR